MLAVTIVIIEVLEENDTPSFFERAKSIIDSILGKKSLDVETVSGATFSSGTPSRRPREWQRSKGWPRQRKRSWERLWKRQR